MTDHVDPSPTNNLKPHRLTSNTDNQQEEASQRSLVNSQSYNLQHNKYNRVQFTSSTEQRQYQRTEFDFR